jgi:hypothetical protein
MQSLTSYIPAAGFLAILVLLVWAGYRRADRVRAKYVGQMDAQIEAMNKNTEAVERIASALEARNQNRPPSNSN